MPDDKADELHGEIVALRRPWPRHWRDRRAAGSSRGGGAEAALSAMEAMAAQLEGSVPRGVVGAEEAGRPGAAIGSERRMELIVHALRNVIAFRND